MRYLIIKTSAVGDVIQCFPALDYLKTKAPFAQIDWIVEEESAALLRAHPYVDNVIEIRTKKWRKSWLSSSTLGDMKRELHALRSTEYNVLFDFQGNIKSFFISGLAKAYVKVGWTGGEVQESIGSFFLTRRFKKHGALSAREEYIHLLAQFFQDPNPRIDVPKVDLQASLGVLPPKGNKKRILVTLGARWENKRLSYESLIQGLQNLAESHEIFFVWGNETERKRCEFMNAAFKGESYVLPKLTLLELYSIMKQVDRVVSMDSMPLHLAAYAGVPTLSFFGPSLPQAYAPDGDEHFTFRGNCPYNVSFSMRCPKLRSCATGACIKNVTSKDIEAMLYKSGEISR
jgi:heptosyltransferase I